MSRCEAADPTNRRVAYLHSDPTNRRVAYLHSSWVHGSCSQVHLRADEHAMLNTLDPTEIHQTVEPFIALTQTLCGSVLSKP